MQSWKSLLDTVVRGSLLLLSLSPSGPHTPDAHTRRGWVLENVDLWIVLACTKGAVLFHRVSIHH